MRTVRFHPNASEELEAIVAYYEGRRPGLGALFLAETKKANDRIVELPAAAREVRSSIRRRSIHRFPYFFYYAVEENEVFIIAVAHKRRRPEYWINRL
jgi:plasmid stabilization system protein ParE